MWYFTSACEFISKIWTIVSNFIFQKINNQDRACRSEKFSLSWDDNEIDALRTFVCILRRLRKL